MHLTTNCSIVLASSTGLIGTAPTRIKSRLQKDCWGCCSWLLSAVGLLLALLVLTISACPPLCKNLWRSPLSEFWETAWLSRRTNVKLNAGIGSQAGKIPSQPKIEIMLVPLDYFAADCPEWIVVSVVCQNHCHHHHYCWGYHCCSLDRWTFHYY